MSGKAGVLLLEILTVGLVESHLGLEMLEVCLELAELEGHCIALVDGV